MKKLFFILLILPGLCIAQKKGFVALQAVGGFTSLNPLYGFEASGNFQLAQGFYAGLSVGVNKFTDVNHVIIPLSLPLTIFPATKNALKPFIVLQPGYGAYHQTITKDISQEGGVYFYGGLGVAGNGNKAAPLLSIGFVHYTFTTNNKGYTTPFGYNGVAFKFGVMLK